MEQKRNNTPVTEASLKKILKDYPTKTDMQRELDERFANFHKALSAEMDFKLAAMEERIMGHITKFANRIFTAIDPLLNELETRQRDREIATAKMKSVEGDVEDLKKRVARLEHK